KGALTGALAASGLWACGVLAQQAGKAPSEQSDATDDAVNQAAGKLEAELNNYKEASPEAAVVMLKLVDLYHQEARVFGVVRIGRKFVAAHPSHPQHKDVMLKLIDGLEATTRYPDFVAACRQFLQRYPDAPECPAIDVRLTAVLD